MKAMMIRILNEGKDNPLRHQQIEGGCARGRHKVEKCTFCKLSLLPNGELRGELLRVYVLGLFASDGIPSLLDSILHFRLREINAFKPLNHTSASSLSLQIW